MGCLGIKYTCGGDRPCVMFNPFPAPAGRSATFIKGQCRRRAPVLDLRSSEGPKSMWPLTRSTDWCGEHMEWDNG